MSSQLNWFGMPAHVTDQYIHWNDSNPQAKAAVLRPSWDALVAAGLEAQADIMIQAAYDAGRRDEYDANSPDL